MFIFSEKSVVFSKVNMDDIIVLIEEKNRFKKMYITKNK
jgi:hypothetical protein